MISKNLIENLEKLLAQMPAVWDGRKAILKMRDSGYPHWKQMEWIGFYFQFLCDMKLPPLVKIPGPKYGKVEFDGFSEIPWDFKVHPDKSANGQDNKSVIVNDRLAIAKAIKQFGGAGLILAIGYAKYNDEDRSFQVWHQELKGGLSEFEKQRILRKAPSRLRKTAFRLREIKVILLDDKKVRGLGSFQEGFRNSDGSSRNAKVLLDLGNITAEKTIKF
ncbi:MAG: hypothetical protein G01um101433_832 [Parcubacteria group bacterium Gr01-1014_33]|nr:MAG: hypothetical protein G01um101433_832 [Parcubacteria group bacterium Gr01-1014_33]